MVYNIYEVKLMTYEQIRILAVKLNISLSEMARQTGESPQNFIKKLQRDTLSPTDLKNIAEKLGIGYESHFILKDGEKI